MPLDVARLDGKLRMTQSPVVSAHGAATIIDLEYRFTERRIPPSSDYECPLKSYCIENFLVD